jgi:phosphoribosylanthranilate isomerase
MIKDVKICGLSTPETVEAAVSGGATHVGFIFFARSPRHVDAEKAAALADLARGRALSVAVTVDADDDALDAIVTRMGPDLLQLHGQETPERVAAVKQRFGLPAMKALAIRDRDDLRRINAYRGIADRFLFDAKAPEGSELPGGNGVVFDWALLGALDGTIDYMLSGGINKANVAEALALTGAPGIDVSSGVESAPGVKDVTLIKALLEELASIRRNGGVGEQGVSRESSA